MRIKLAVALAALPFATTANAANVYAACGHEDATGNSLMTQLFTLKGDALRDYYGEWTYEKNKAWEEQFAKEPDSVRPISGYYDYNFVGQFSKYAEAHGDSHAGCWVTTSKEHALAWFATQSARRDIVTNLIRDWMPKDAGVVGVSDWSGRPVGAAVEADAEPEADEPSSRKTDEAASDSAPARHKMTNAEADAKFAADRAEYEKKLAEQKRKVAEYEQAQADVAKRKTEQAAAAQNALDAFRKEKEAHDAQVAQYEREVAAQNYRAEFDRRHALGEPSTDTDANQCVTTAETRLNDTFQGNTSASIINGCGQPVDVRICLMTDKSWNCGVRWGVASQGSASFSSFNATGQVFVDAKITGSGKALASPN